MSPAMSLISSCPPTRRWEPQSSARRSTRASGTETFTTLGSMVQKGKFSAGATVEPVL